MCAEGAQCVRLNVYVDSTAAVWRECGGAEGVAVTSECAGSVKVERGRE